MAVEKSPKQSASELQSNTVTSKDEEEDEEDDDENEQVTEEAVEEEFQPPDISEEGPAGDEEEHNAPEDANSQPPQQQQQEAVEQAAAGGGAPWNLLQQMLGGAGAAAGGGAAILPEQLLAMGNMLPDEEAMMNLAIALSLVSKWRIRTFGAWAGLIRVYFQYLYNLGWHSVWWMVCLKNTGHHGCLFKCQQYDWSCMAGPVADIHTILPAFTSHVLCKHSNSERASLANLKLTIGSLLACS